MAFASGGAGAACQAAVAADELPVRSEHGAVGQRLAVGAERLADGADGDDPRVRATVLAIADELTVDELVLRYRTDETAELGSGTSVRIMPSCLDVRYSSPFAACPSCKSARLRGPISFSRLRTLISPKEAELR